MQLNEASILLVDDEPVLLEILGEWLKRVAGQVFCAENGAKALQVLAKNKIDLIVTDLRMPVMDGVTLSKRVKADGLHTPRVILISGFTDIEAREFYDLGAEAVLEKPVERDDLLNAMRRSLAQRSELWQSPPQATPYQTLRVSFRSLATALHEHRIAFGQGGFCLEIDQSLVEGPINIELDFNADQYVLSGQGVVRWLAHQEGQAGIELVYLARGSLQRAVQLAENSTTFIPGTTGSSYQAQARQAGPKVEKPKTDECVFPMRPDL